MEDKKIETKASKFEHIICIIIILAVLIKLVPAIVFHVNKQALKNFVTEAKNEHKTTSSLAAFSRDSGDIICVAIAYGTLQLKEITQYKNYDRIDNIGDDDYSAVAMIDTAGKEINIYDLNDFFRIEKTEGFSRGGIYKSDNCAYRNKPFKIILRNRFEITN